MGCLKRLGVGLLNKIGRLLVFQQCPQDFPYSSRLLYLATAGNFFVKLVLLIFLPYTLAVRDIANVAFSVVLLSLFSWVILAIARKSSRYVQTTLCLQLCDMALSVAVFTWAMLPLVNQVGFFLMLIYVWAAAVATHILRESLESSLGVAVLVTFILIAIRIVLIMVI